MCIVHVSICVPNSPGINHSDPPTKSAQGGLRSRTERGGERRREEESSGDDADILSAALTWLRTQTDVVAPKGVDVLCVTATDEADKL